MGSSNIKPIRDQIKATSAYHNLSKMMQLLITKRNNVLIIDHGVTVVNNIGYKNWERQSNFNWANKNIVKEITKQEPIA
jgi:hypothetical protein